MKIFLSYAQADWEWVSELAASLRAAGIEVNGQDDDFILGGDLGQFFREKLEAAEIMVPVLTERSLRSSRVLFDWGAAKGLGKQVVPLLVEKEGEMPQIPFDLASQFFIKAKSPQEAAAQLKRFTSERLAEA